MDTHQPFKKCQTLGKVKYSNYLLEKWKYLYVNEEPINSNIRTYGSICRVCCEQCGKIWIWVVVVMLATGSPLLSF